MKKIIVIPARLNSLRLKEKILINIDGKPMIQHVWERVKLVNDIADIFIAVDDKKVYDIVKSFGGNPIYTFPNHLSGTDRVAEIARKTDGDIFINVQADEININPLMIEELIKNFEKEPSMYAATLIKKITNKKEISDINIVKVVKNKKDDVIYFSRSPIPYDRINDNIYFHDLVLFSPYFKHIGIYIYTKIFLATFQRLSSNLEKIEKLEQLRILENGYKIKCIETDYDTISINDKKDLRRIKC